MNKKNALQLVENSSFKSVTQLIDYFQKKQSSKHIYKPVGIELEITNQCNLRCRGCPIIVDEEKTTDTLINKDFINLLIEAKKSDFIAYSITGGEPFLKFQLIKTIIKSGHGLDLYKLNTNCSFFKTPDLTKKYLEQLKESGFGEINKYIKPVMVISLGHQNLAGVPIQNAVNLTSTIYEVFDSKKVGCVLNITDMNPFLTKKIYSDFKTLYSKHTGEQFNEQLFKVRFFPINNAVTLKRLGILGKEKVSILKRINEFKTEYISGGCFNIHIKNTENPKKAETLTPKCVLRPNGDFYSCQGFNYVHLIGNIKNNSLKSIISQANNNLVLNTVFKKNLEGLYNLAFKLDKNIEEAMVNKTYSPCDVCQTLTNFIKNNTIAI